MGETLRAHGYDALSVHEADALGLSDEEQLTRATTESRVLLSCNYAHFLRLGAAPFVARSTRVSRILTSAISTVR